MPDIKLERSVPLPAQTAFAVFTEQMDTWWPRQGVFPYSFAPKTTRPQHIRFETRPGGRYYESFADGSELVIGRITLWQPPQSLAYTWRDPTWADDTSIQLAFSDDDAGARIVYRQNGFAAAGVEWLIPYYRVGCTQTLAAYVAHCRALHAVQELGLSLD
ncbi:MAG: SRPBCC domain-containing protein [Chloroflexi bacterium]|nr:SRPBCC domain-containing protein [Chloroflexota bacterium]